MPYANIVPTPLVDGIVYCANTPVTPTEAALGDATQIPVVVPVADGQTVVALVSLAVNGQLTGNNTYVFLQTDLGNDVWVDVAWCRTTIGNGTVRFVLCGGGLGAMNNAFGPLRNSSSAPSTQGSGSNAVPLGGRIRFTGFSVLVGGSSSIAGTIPLMYANIIYKLQHPR